MWSQYDLTKLALGPNPGGEHLLRLSGRHRDKDYAAPMPDVLITEFMAEDVVAALASDLEVHYDPALFADRPALMAMAGEARGLIVRNKTLVDRALLDAAPRLLVVGRLGVGLDNIDIDECAVRNIAVRPATGANADSVAEYVIGSLLVLLRPALNGTARLLAGNWPRQDSVGREVGGKRLGLVGLGGIARLVAEKARFLGMSIMAHDPLLPPDDPAWSNVASAPLEHLLAEADAVSLHIPLVEATRNVIDSAAMALMKPTAILINTARGGIVDEAALAAALRAGRLAGAALDVFAAEPPDASTIETFRGVDNLILTPHIAGLTDESQAKVSQVTAANVRRVLAERGP